MVVRFKKCELKIDQIHKEEFSHESFVEHEIKVIELIKGWLKNDPYFEFKTSGSTGKARSIHIEREKIEYSCKTTMEKLDPHHKFRTSLLCINPEMIGGAMVVFRALIWGLDLHVIKPSSNPFELVGNESKFDLTSMVPLQLQDIQGNRLDCFNTILVGGGHYPNELLSRTSTKIYLTFGMTETVSHFALKLMGEDTFDCLGDINIEEQPDKKLAIRGTLTNHKLLITNDLIEFISTKKFNWIGRSDFIINSGGIKISPEEVEDKLVSVLDRKFIISHLPDDVLGNKVVLIVEGESFNVNDEFAVLERYQRPKEVHFVRTFVHTPSQKIDRIKTRELLLKSLNYRS